MSINIKIKKKREYTSMIEERRKYFRSVCGVQILFLLRRYESIIFLLKSKSIII